MPMIKYKNRNHFNISIQGYQKILCMVLHITKPDLEWFNKNSEVLLKELLDLIQKHVNIRGEIALDRLSSVEKSTYVKPVAGLVTGKRARPGDLPCVQGTSLQFTYHFRKTQPSFTILLPNPNKRLRTDANLKQQVDGSSSFRSFSVSEKSLLVWVYRFDPQNPYAPLPSQASNVLPITNFFKKKEGKPTHDNSSPPHDEVIEVQSSALSKKEEEDIQLAIALSLSST
mmetsp:Transcript_7039/g.9430  ORF Transcript_7039/g.9430 Transcript_7039/m.9430 type:complete len:228 (-) Transcript_7039:51-734(-)